MAQNKKAEFSEETQRIAEFAKTLAHPARLAIIEMIAKRQDCICGEIVEVLPLAQSTVSQHLKELKEIGIIKGEIEGNKSCYCIDWKRFEMYFQFMRNWQISIQKYKKKQKSKC